MENGGKKCLSTLFTSPAPPGAGEVCAALVAAEMGASEDHCEVLNVEGAFGTDGMLWLGLRAPLAGGRAVLLRLVTGFKDLRFDRVALLDLEGRGIRELALVDDLLYGLAGPTLDAEVSFALFRAAVPDVVVGGEPPVKILRHDLLPSSEGLLVRKGRAYVLLDGDSRRRPRQVRRSGRLVHGGVAIAAGGGGGRMGHVNASAEPGQGMRRSTS